MRIIYFTNAIEPSVYAESINKGNAVNNPSNQNFHNKMIEAMALTNYIDVIAITDISCQNKVTKNISWHYYLKTEAKKNIFKLIKRIKKDINKQKDEEIVVFADTINLRLTWTAIRFARRIHAPRVGYCTDNPLNISGLKKIYQKLLLKFDRKFNAFICLTDELNALFNKKNKPFIIVEGVVKENNKKLENNKYKDYFFFAGALLEKYGIYNLIEAYKKIENCNKKLIICGHHYDEKKFNDAIKNDPRIIFLKTLPEEQILGYEHDAFANINARPINKEIDDYSIPSKTLEYLASGKLTISVYNEKIHKHFGEELIWARGGEVFDIKKAIEESLSLSTYIKEEKERNAKIIAMNRYSYEAVNFKIDCLIKAVTSKYYAKQS